MVAGDLQAEIRELRARIAALVAAAAKNERLLKRNQERELELLKAESLAQLLDVICSRLSKSFRLETVTLLLWDPDHEIRHLLISDDVKLESFPDVIFTDSFVSMGPQFRSFHKPWLGPFDAEDHQLLFGSTRSHLKSVAFIPLWRQGRLHGTLNFGSRDEKRFTRHLATDFLAHLGVITSFAIENAINRARLVRSGLTDFLTGWHNRRYLHARLKEELVRAQRHGSGVYCLIIDLDHFKEINDQHGHLAGDAALREAAHRIDHYIRGSDTAARFGGDEFVVLAPGLTPEQALSLADRIRRNVSDKPVELGPGVSHTMTVSIGIAGLIPARSDEDPKVIAERLLAAADSALYQAKRNGRDRAEISLDLK